MTYQGPYRDGRVHVLARRCSTCIFRAGNLMHLRAGRVKDMVAEANEEDSGITCHQTLEDYGYGVDGAVCRGYFDHPHRDSLSLRMAEAFQVLEYVEPPA